MKKILILLILLTIPSCVINKQIVHDNPTITIIDNELITKDIKIKVSSQFKYQLGVKVFQIEDKNIDANSHTFTNQESTLVLMIFPKEEKEKNNLFMKYLDVESREYKYAIESANDAIVEQLGGEKIDSGLEKINDIDFSWVIVRKSHMDSFYVTIFYMYVAGENDVIAVSIYKNNSFTHNDLTDEFYKAFKEKSLSYFTCDTIKDTEETNDQMNTNR
jgi:hypothetical protein